MGKHSATNRKYPRESTPPSRRTRERKAEIKAGFDKLMAEVQSSRVHFRNVVERNADGVIVVAHDGAVQYVNPAAELLFGANREEIVGRSFGLPVDSDAPVEVDFVTSEGTPGTGEMRVVATEWEGQPATLISFRDITDRKRAEREIQDLNEQLEARVQRRTEQLESYSP